MNPIRRQATPQDLTNPITPPPGDAAKEAALNESMEHTGIRSNPVGYHVQQLLDSATAPLREERDNYREEATRANDYIRRIGVLLGCSDGDDTPEIRIAALRTRAERAERERDEFKNAAFHMHDGELVHTLRTRLEEAEKIIATLEALDSSACDHIEALKTRLAELDPHPKTP